jgi:hypothetical protein
MKATGLSILTFGALCGAACAQPAAPTVESLMKSGFTVAGIIPSNAGPEIFLVKGDQFYGCSVSETPESEEITTRYCQKVR